MPPYVPRRANPLIIGLVFTLLVGGIIALFISIPWLGTAMITLAIIGSIVGCIRDKKTAEERRGQSICTFARRINCRETDTWIVRAVYEEVSSLVNFPIRLEDRLVDDLHIDPEDVEDLAEAIAQRTSRPLSQKEDNPVYGEVFTVRDLILFFVKQPITASRMIEPS